MSRIRVQYFGSIQEGNVANDGWIDIKKVTVFIGNQGSGKSTIAKLISTFSWIEKALVRGDYDQKWFERKNRLRSHFLPYHRLENYFKKGDDKQTVIEYEGDRYTIIYKDDTLHIEEVKRAGYALPQIMYVPAERNFISYVKSYKELELSSDALKEFLSEFDNAKRELVINKGIRLPINETILEYNKYNDTLSLRGKGDSYLLGLSDASSGFQSLVPLYLVTYHLAKLTALNIDKRVSTIDEIKRFQQEFAKLLEMDLTVEQRRVAVSLLTAKFNKTAFINIVEEPEQNLFPSSQWELLHSLLQFNTRLPSNKLILTTHSPYIVNYLNIAIQAADVEKKVLESKNKERLLVELYKIVNKNALVSMNDVAIYELNEEDGSIQLLPSPYGIPTDKNYLNNQLRKGNLLFDQLLEIEEQC